MTLQQHSTSNLWQMPMTESVDARCYEDSQTKIFKKGALIYKAGEHANKLFLIDEGEVKVVDQGKSNALSFIKWFSYSGDLIGLSTMSDKPFFEDFAVAMTDVKVKIFRKTDVLKLIKKDVNFNSFILQQISKHNNKLEQRLTTRFTLTSKQRVISLLIQLAKDKGLRVGYELLIKSSLTHQEIADYTNTSRQTVTTVLNKLRNQNLLIFNRRRILLRDFEKLKTILYKSDY